MDYLCIRKRTVINREERKMTLSDDAASNLTMVILHKNYQQSEKEAELYESFELLKN